MENILVRYYKTQMNPKNTVKERFGRLFDKYKSAENKLWAGFIAGKYTVTEYTRKAKALNTRYNKRLRELEGV